MFFVNVTRYVGKEAFQGSNSLSGLLRISRFVPELPQKEMDIRRINGG